MLSEGKGETSGAGRLVSGGDGSLAGGEYVLSGADFFLPERGFLGVAAGVWFPELAFGNSAGIFRVVSGPGAALTGVDEFAEVDLASPGRFVLPFNGRERELDTLREVSRSGSGGSGAMVLIA